MGPALDSYIKNDWVTIYTWTSAAIVALALSCGSAVAVNVSQFMCLGRFSALSYQVMIKRSILCIQYTSLIDRLPLL